MVLPVAWQAAMKSTESEIDSLTAPGISLAQYQQLEVEVNTLQVSLSRSVHGLYWLVLWVKGWCEVFVCFAGPTRRAFEEACSGST